MTTKITNMIERDLNEIIEGCAKYGISNFTSMKAKSFLKELVANNPSESLLKALATHEDVFLWGYERLIRERYNAWTREERKHS